MKIGDRYCKHYDVGEKCYIAFDDTDTLHPLEICCNADLKTVVKAAKSYSKEHDIPLTCISVFEMVKED